MKAQKAKRPKKQDLITCPKCGSISIIIYEHFDLLRCWFQDQDGVGGLLDFEEESESRSDFLDFACQGCSHKWTSDEFTTMEELMDEVYGEVIY